MQGKWVSPSPKQQQQPVLISFLRSLAHTHTHTHTYTHGISCIWGPGWVGWGGGTRLSQPNSPHFRSLAPLPPPPRSLRVSPTQSACPASRRGYNGTTTCMQGVRVRGWTICPGRGTRGRWQELACPKGPGLDRPPSESTGSACRCMALVSEPKGSNNLLNDTTHRNGRQKISHI